MTMGGLDFSQGSILGISSIVVCILSQKSIPLAIIGGIASGAAIGALNGYFYVFRKIKSFIVTICTMFLFRGFIKYLTTNAPVAGSAKLINYDSTGLKVCMYGSYFDYWIHCIPLYKVRNLSESNRSRCKKQQCSLVSVQIR